MADNQLACHLPSEFESTSAITKTGFTSVQFQITLHVSQVIHSEIHYRVTGKSEKIAETILLRRQSKAKF